MNYYYDIMLNWNDDKTYEFYEWNDTDYLELIKKIPIFKIKHKNFLEIVMNNIKISNDWLDLIRDKTLISSKKLIDQIPFACLITDSKNVIALEFNKDGEVISRSNLLIDDELSILELAYNLKESELNYEITSPIIFNNDLRQIREVRRLINLEINSLYHNKDINKLKYLYYEYKGEEVQDIEIIYNSLKEDLDKCFNKKFLKLYYIIKLSYHNV